MTSKKKTSKQLVACLILSLMIFTLGMPAQVAQAQSASDISGHWAYEQITNWINKGYVRGYEDGSFRPNNPITRAEFSVLVNKAFNFNETTAISYADVAETDWFYKTMAQAKAAGYMTGYEDGTARPNASITRQEAAAVVSKLKNLGTNDSAANKFTDAAIMPTWSKGFIGAVAEAGYMSGYPDGSFQPTQNISRAEAIVVLNKVLGDKVEEPQEGSVKIANISNKKVRVNSTIEVEVKVDPEDAKIQIKNSDDKVVEATLKNNKIQLKGLKEGSADITVTATKEGLNDAKVTFKVEVQRATSSGGGGGGSSSGSSQTRFQDVVDLNKSQIIVVLEGYAGVAKIQLKDATNTTATITVNGDELTYNAAEKAYIGSLGGTEAGKAYNVIITIGQRTYSGTIKAAASNDIIVSGELVVALDGYAGAAKIQLRDAANKTATITVNGDKLSYDESLQAYTGAVGGVEDGETYDVTIDGKTYENLLRATK